MTIKVAVLLVFLGCMPAVADEAFRPLFNGKDLTGWTTTGNWTVEENGVLLITPREGETGWKRYDDYIWTDRKYGDFVLDLEYSYPKGGNSGVFFRVGDLKDPVNSGIEAQILDSSEKKDQLTAHDHGGIIRTAAPTRNMSKLPGEWNRMVVTCRGDHLQVVLNDELIIDVDLADSAVKDRPPTGYIGLQDHGQPHNIRFRNIRIKELP